MRPTAATLWTGNLPDSSAHGFSRQEYWSGLPFLSPGNLPDPGIQPVSPLLQADSLPTELQVEPRISLYTMLIILFRIIHEVTKSTIGAVQSLMCLTLGPHELQQPSYLLLTLSQSLLKLTSIQSVVPSNHLTLCHLLLLLHSIFPSISLFQ